MKNFHLIYVLFLGLLASCSGKGEGKKNKEKPPVTVEVMIAGKQEFVSIVEVNGTVLSNEMVELHPEVSGRIVYLNVVDGGLVNE